MLSLCLVTDIIQKKVSKPHKFDGTKAVPGEGRGGGVLVKEIVSNFSLRQRLILGRYRQMYRP
jgi:hypothetical protein